MIEFKNVKFNFKNIDVSNDISFCIEDNTTTCFLGNKNSGKSVMLKMLAGIYKNYEGQILVDNQDIKEKIDKKIGIILDKVERDPEITVSEYLYFYGGIYDTINKKELESYIDEQLKDFSLMSYKHTNINHLDTNTMKIVDMIRLSILNPDIMLFDNLFSTGDIDFNETVNNYLKKYLGKKTMIFASRNYDYLDNICDHIGILENGVVLLYDTKDKIYDFANVANKIEVKINSRIDDAISILNSNPNITNLSYDNDTITFSTVLNDLTISSKDFESNILKELVDGNVQVYSFKKQQVKFGQLFNAAKGL